jgi:hypothetical protein
MLEVRQRGNLLMKRNPLLLCWLLLATPAIVEAQFNYTVTNQTITITAYTGTNSVVAVPSTIDGLPVTSIGYEAFYESGITSVTIPNSVISIGDFAFSGCTNLASVTIPNSVTSIGEAAFNGCFSLTNVAIPSSVTKIGISAFNHCYGLTSVSIPNSVTSIGNGAFDYCTNLTNVSIPNSIARIADYAFEGCSSLTGVTIPNGVTSIGEYAFNGCFSLTNVAIPSSVTKIGISAFGICTSLTGITIPDSVTSIGDQAFEACSSLTSIYFQGNAPSLGSHVFVFDKATAYYLPGTAGWGSPVGDGIPTGFWILPYPLILNRSFGVRSNQFGFTVSWATYLSVVVEASTSLSSPVWQPVQTNALNNGVVNFIDPEWTNHPNRFYRIRSQ